VFLGKCFFLSILIVPVEIDISGSKFDSSMCPMEITGPFGIREVIYQWKVIDSFQKNGLPLKSTFLVLLAFDSLSVWDKYGTTEIKEDRNHGLSFCW
jgi:hypothetical protein